MAGTYLYEIVAHLEQENYKYIVNTDRQILTITFYECTTDLSISDYQYTLNSAALKINVPQLQFNPSLHESETITDVVQSDGSTIQTT